MAIIIQVVQNSGRIVDAKQVKAAFVGLIFLALIIIPSYAEAPEYRTYVPNVVTVTSGTPSGDINDVASLDALYYSIEEVDGDSFVLTTTADFDAGDKGESENNTNVETITDNLGMTANQIEVVNAKGDAFQTADQYANTRKWRPGYFAGSSSGYADISHIKSGELTTNVSVAASTGYGVMSRFAISGDFSIQIKLDAGELKSVNTGIMGFYLTKSIVGLGHDSNNRVQILRKYQAGHWLQSSLIVGGAVVGSEVTYSTTETDISFRVNRSGTDFKTFYDIGSGWVEFLSESGSIGDVRIWILSYTATSYPDVEAYWDNLIVNVGTLIAGYPSFGESFIRDSSNPLTIPKPVGATGVVHPDVLYFPDGEDGYKFWMYYTPIPSAYEFPSLVRSNDGITWTEDGVSNPLISNGSSGEWDGDFAPDPDVCIVDGTWYLYYIALNDTGSPNNAQIGLATSSDGKTFTKSSQNPVINQTDFETETGVSVLQLRAPSCYYDSSASQFHLLFDTDESNGGFKFRIWAANSTDGENFTINTTPVLSWTSDGSNDDRGVAHPDISYYDGTYYLYYHGFPGVGDKYRKALATSTSINSSYVRSNYNPVIDIVEDSWEETTTYRSCPVVRGRTGNITLIDGQMWTYYSGWSSTGASYVQIGFAKSHVGVWESDTQTMPVDDYLFSLTISHSVTTDNYIDEVYAEVAGVEKARWSTNLTSGSSTLLNAASLTTGDLYDVHDDFTIVIEMRSSTSGTPVVTAIDGITIGYLYDFTFTWNSLGKNLKSPTLTVAGYRSDAEQVVLQVWRVNAWYTLDMNVVPQGAVESKFYTLSPSDVADRVLQIRFTDTLNDAAQSTVYLDLLEYEAEERADLPSAPIDVFIDIDYDMWTNEIFVKVWWVQTGGPEPAVEIGKWATLEVDGHQLGVYEIGNGTRSIAAPWTWWDGDNHNISAVGALSVNWSWVEKSQTYYSEPVHEYISNFVRWVAVMFFLFCIFSVVLVVVVKVVKEKRREVSD